MVYISFALLCGELRHAWVTHIIQAIARYPLDEACICEQAVLPPCKVLQQMLRTLLLMGTRSDCEQCGQGSADMSSPPSGARQVGNVRLAYVSRLT